jgi:hypothetical protein
MCKQTKRFGLPLSDVDGRDFDFADAASQIQSENGGFLLCLGMQTYYILTKNDIPIVFFQKIKNIYQLFLYLQIKLK